MARTISEAERQTARFNRMSPAKAAKILGVSAAQVRTYIEDGELKARDFAKHGAKKPYYLIDPADVEAFDEARIVIAKAKPDAA